MVVRPIISRGVAIVEGMVVFVRLRITPRIAA